MRTEETEPEKLALAQNETEQELRYLRRCVERDAAKILLMDLQSVTMRHELEQKRRGFALMAELTQALSHGADYTDIFMSVSRRVNAALNMQRTIALRPDADGRFRAVVLQGYPIETQKNITSRRITLDAELLDPERPVMITGADPAERLAAFRQAIELPYLISCPLVLQNDIVALLVTGRVVEQKPFFLRLTRGDMETVQAVSAYLAAILTAPRLQKAENLANYDPLTQLPNLRRTTELLRHTLEAAQSGGYHTAIMFVDLDGFKAINDTYGHAAGDAVLRAVAERLKRTVRESDHVGRIGGDEFIVLLSRIGCMEDAGIAATKILARLAQAIHVENTGQCHVGASIGIAVFPDHGSEASALLDAADAAMYSVKNKGKNDFTFAQCAQTKAQ